MRRKGPWMHKVSSPVQVECVVLHMHVRCVLEIVANAQKRPSTKFSAHPQNSYENKSKTRHFFRLIVQLATTSCFCLCFVHTLCLRSHNACKEKTVHHVGWLDGVNSYDRPTDGLAL